MNISKKLILGISCAGLLATSLVRCNDELKNKRKKYLELASEKTQMKLNFLTGFGLKKEEQWESYEYLKDLCCKAKKEYDEAKDARYFLIQSQLQESEDRLWKLERNVNLVFGKAKSPVRSGSIKKYSGIVVGFGLIGLGLWQFFKK